jgi:hypothetical protein
MGKPQPIIEEDPELEEVYISSYSDPGIVTSIWSPTKYPPLKIKTNNVEREIQVSVRSTLTEDTQLLHKLLSATRTAA